MHKLTYTAKSETGEIKAIINHKNSPKRNILMFNRSIVSRRKTHVENLIGAFLFAILIQHFNYLSVNTTNIIKYDNV